jgi:fermentation-respiration switch protein FrsA (DUF1100 family)
MAKLLTGILSTMIASMIFFPSIHFDETPEDYGLSYEEVNVLTSDQVPLFGWFLKTPGVEKATILFYHGNAGNISHRLFKAKGWVDRGYSVFLIDYRGYGRSRGAIRHQEDILKDARAALDWLGAVRKIPGSKTVLYGESLGTYPAIRLAGTEKFKAVILESPFTSFADLAARHYAFIPQVMAKMLLRDFEFPNRDLIAKVRAPVFVMQGTSDQICPYEMGKEIYELAPAPKEFYAVTKGDHNDLPLTAGEDYWNKPAAFIEKRP